MTIERRIAEELQAFADLDVDDDEVERALLAFHARRARPVRRRATTARRLTAAATVAAIAAGGIWWASRPGRDASLPAVQPSLSRVEAFVGVSPLGATPSTPERGTLVLEVPVHATGCGLDSPHGEAVAPPGSVHVYADGRVIRAQHANLPEGANSRFTGYLERRLTPTGVDRLLSESLSAGRRYDPGANAFFSRWWCASFAWAMEGTTRVPLYRRDGTDPFGYRQLYDLSWLPDHLWAEPSWHGFVPSRFAACYSAPGERQGKDAILRLLPDQAASLLRPRSQQEPGLTDQDGVGYCAPLSTQEARSLSVALDSAHLEHWEHSEFALGYRLATSAKGPTELFLEPLLPHGDWVCAGCG